MIVAVTIIMPVCPGRPLPPSGVPANALISRIDGSPLISRMDGSILVSRIAA